MNNHTNTSSTEGQYIIAQQCIYDIVPATKSKKK